MESIPFLTLSALRLMGLALAARHRFLKMEPKRSLDSTRARRAPLE